MKILRPPQTPAGSESLEVRPRNPCFQKPLGNSNAGKSCCRTSEVEIVFGKTSSVVFLLPGLASSLLDVICEELHTEGPRRPGQILSAGLGTIYSRGCETEGSGIPQVPPLTGAFNQCSLGRHCSSSLTGEQACVTPAWICLPATLP